MFLLLAQSSSDAPLQTSLQPGLLPTILFYAAAALTVGSALAIPFSKDLRRAATGLLGTFVGLAGLYLLLHAQSPAIAVLLVGVAGTLPMILVTLRFSARSPAMTPVTKDRQIWAPALALAIAGGLIFLFTHSAWPARASGPPAEGPGIADIGTALLSAHAPAAAFLLALELLSILLLIVMVGAAYLARRHRPMPPQSFYSPIPPAIAPPSVSPGGHPPQIRPRPASSAPSPQRAAP